MIITSVEAVLETFNRESLAVDIETSGFSAWRNLIAVISLADRDGNVAVLHTRGSVPPRLIRWLEGAGLLIGHNVVNFDGPFLALNGMDVFTVPWFDTLVAEMVISSVARHDISKKLADVLPRRLGPRAQKQTMVDHGGWMNDSLTEEQTRYAAGDVVHLHDLMRAQLSKASEHPTQLKALDLEMAVVPVVMRMVVNGMPLDVFTLEDMIADRTRKRDEVYPKIAERLGPINMRSPVQVKRALAVDGIHVPSTNFETMRSLELSGNTLASLILKYKQYDQPIKTYSPGWTWEHRQDDGAVHARYWQCGADTGRFTSTEPNMQQIPKDMRTMFAAPPGYKIISADYSQIEVRLAAAASHDAAMLEALRQEDIHTAVAASIFNKPTSEVTDNERSLAKAGSFTLMFGGGATTLWQYSYLSGGTMSLEDAQRFLVRFFAQFRGLNAFREQARYRANSHYPVVIELQSGLRRVLVSQVEKTPQRILNSTIQGNACVGLKYALRRLKATPTYKYISAVVHDEIVAVVPEIDAREHLQAMCDCMVAGMTEFTDAPIKVEGTSGNAWSKHGDFEISASNYEEDTHDN